MKLKSKITGFVFDVPNEEGQSLLKLGNVEEVKPIVKPEVLYGDLKWVARIGFIEGDYQHPPFIHTSCNVCGHKQFTESQKGTAHTNVIRHCGSMRIDSCPADVAAKYQELFNEWKSRSRKDEKQMKAERERTSVSPHTPAHISRLFGVKSQKELIAEAVVGAKRFPGGNQL